MKLLNFQKVRTLFALIFCCAISYSALSQSIKGTIKDEDGNTLPGASVVIKGTTNGVSTDLDGKFTINNISNGAYTLVISFVGFETQETNVSVPQKTPLALTLKANQAVLDEVVVTGLFNPKSRIESSVAISTISSEDLQLEVPSSGADLLKKVPGVYVNSALGEVRNIVNSRGISANAGDAAYGYYYVSLQEDGLPVSNVMFRNFVPDYFFRPDATINRVEAIRGGSAAITGANAPGGIFNYITKTGGNTFKGTVSARYGLQGDGQNPYYRGDFNLGGPLTNNKKWSYNIGGFYRYSYGDHSPGYAMNYGGQLKANVMRTYKKGYVKIYGKYLNDHNGQAEYTPSSNFSDPQPVNGFDNTSSVYSQQVEQPFYINGDLSDERTHDVSKLIHNTQQYIGAEWKHNFDNGWSVNNNARYSHSNVDWYASIVVSPMSLDSVSSFGIMGLLGEFGTYTFTDSETGEVLGQVEQSPNIVNGEFAGFNIDVVESNFPGDEVAENSVLFQPLASMYATNNEFTDQLSITKKTDNMTFTLGGFVSLSSIDLIGFEDAAVSIGTIEDRPHMIAVSLEGTDGKTYQVTNDNNVMKIGGTGRSLQKALQANYAAFFGHTWDISQKLSLDYGGRLEYTGMNGTFNPAVPNPLTGTAGYGGVDGDTLTLYDEFDGSAGDDVNYNKGITTFSYSIGANYSLNKQTAFYIRFTDGRKAPNATFYYDLENDEEVDNLEPKAQRVVQLEGGVKIIKKKFQLFATPFYSNLSNVSETFVGREENGTFYVYTDLYNTINTFGIELEGNAAITKHFNVRATATFQTSEATEYKVYDMGLNGRDDDVVIDLSGNEMENMPHIMASITPSYTYRGFYINLNYYYMGERQANVANAFKLPGYGVLNTTARYTFNDNWSLTANVNNIFNTYGVMSWTAPGVFPDNLNRAGFTSDMMASNPNASFGTIGIPARSFFATLTYNF